MCGERKLLQRHGALLWGRFPRFTADLLCRWIKELARGPPAPSAPSSPLAPSWGPQRGGTQQPLATPAREGGRAGDGEDENRKLLEEVNSWDCAGRQQSTSAEGDQALNGGWSKIPRLQGQQDDKSDKDADRSRGPEAPLPACTGGETLLRKRDTRRPREKRRPPSDPLTDPSRSLSSLRLLCRVAPPKQRPGTHPGSGRLSRRGSGR